MNYKFFYDHFQGFSALLSSTGKGLKPEMRARISRLARDYKIAETDYRAGFKTIEEEHEHEEKENSLSCPKCLHVIEKKYEPSIQKKVDKKSLKYMESMDIPFGIPSWPQEYFKKLDLKISHEADLACLGILTYPEDKDEDQDDDS